jgi:hypothetical protein
MAEFFKILSIFFTCAFFFAKIGMPTAIVVFKYNLLKVLLVGGGGGIFGAVVFTYLSAGFIKWRHNYRLRRGKIHHNKIFTKFNRRIIRVKNKFGLAGIAFITPVIGTPIGAFLAERFFKDKRKVILYLSVSFMFWAFAIYLFLLIFKGWLT